MAWTVTGNIKGPKGDTGDTGPKGDTGDQGPAGEGIAIAGSVAAYADLPDDLGPDDAGNGYLVEADGLLYIWSGTSFPSDGSGVAFQGPQGPAGSTGSDGADGDSAYQIALDNGFVGSESAWLASLVGATGATGATGAAGAKGDKGDTGDAGATGATGSTGARGSKWFTGTGAPGAIGGSLPGDMYLDLSTGDTYELS
jgi:hypothetical protein